MITGKLMVSGRETRHLAVLKNLVRGTKLYLVGPDEFYMVDQYFFSEISPHVLIGSPRHGFDF